MKELYDRDYFERGIETGKSCYQNYRWIPELTIPMAMTMIDFLGIKPHHTILDFGCAKGYLVKAFRWLNRKAWGVDISKYALDNCDCDVAEYCKNIYEVQYHIFTRYDFIIAKDVFEHIPLDELGDVLKHGFSPSAYIFAIIPLGSNGSYTAPANDLDVTHKNCMPDREWLQFFKGIGLKCDGFTYRVEGIKDSYYEEYPTAHGFFVLRS